MVGEPAFFLRVSYWLEYVLLQFTFYYIVFQEIEKRLIPLDKLRRNLLNPYDPMVRPVRDQSAITTVIMSFQLEYLELVSNFKNYDYILFLKLSIQKLSCLFYICYCFLLEVLMYFFKLPFFRYPLNSSKCNF